VPCCCFSLQGLYEFKIAGLIAESSPYRVAINTTHSTVQSYKLTQQDADSNGQDLLDSDARLSTNGLLFVIDFTSPPFGLSDLSLDFGLVNDLTVGDLVWHDINANGIQDNNEATQNGIDDVTLQVTKQ
jgi:hypothetical protein